MRTPSLRRWLRAERQRWGWMVIDMDPLREGYVRVHVRVWHPGFWVFWLHCGAQRLMQRVRGVAA